MGGSASTETVEILREDLEKHKKQLKDETAELRSSLTKETRLRQEALWERDNDLEEEKRVRRKREKEFSIATTQMFEKIIEIQQQSTQAFQQVADQMSAVSESLRELKGLGKHKDCYPMDIKKKPVGCCLIINNENFKRHSSRYGTQQDRQRLADLFEQFGFEIKEKNDVTKDQMKESLKDHSKLNAAKDMDCCIVIILSHGSHEGIVGTDGRCLSLRNIWHPFTEDGSCWNGKPKLFVLQTSQENQEMESKEQGHLKSAMHDQFSHEALNNPDIFLWCTTVTSSTPASESGSVYIKMFVNTLNEYYHEHDVDSMMTTVRRKVAQIGSLPQPYNTNTLLKKLYFHKQ